MGNLIYSHMDMTEDPCRDFEQYACGGFNKMEHPKDVDTCIQSALTGKTEQFKEFEELIDEPIREEDPLYLKKAKQYFNACCDIESIESLGLQPYFDSGFQYDWPTLNPQWDPSTFDLTKLVSKYLPRHITPILDLKANPNCFRTGNETTHRFDILVKLGFPDIASREKDYYKELAMVLGANETTAAEDAKNHVDILNKLFMNYVASSSVSLDFEDIPEEYDFQNLNISFIIKNELNRIGINFSSYETFTLRTVQYFNVVNNITSMADERTVQNMFGYLYARKYLDMLTNETREAYFKVYEEKRIDNNISRKELCLDNTLNSIFETGIAQYWAERNYPNETRQLMETGFLQMKDAFAEMIEESVFFGGSTKLKARRMLSKIYGRFGHPHFTDTDAYLNKLYERATFPTGNFYEARLMSESEKHSLYVKESTQQLNIKRWWPAQPRDNYASRGKLRNDITVPAMYLKKKHSFNNPSSVGYGLLVEVIGHEIGHAFTSDGNLFYDEVCHIPGSWWSDSEKDEYKNRTQCFIDQYSSFQIPLLNTTVNGITTLRENVADSMAIKNCYRIYKKEEASKPVPQRELPLPVLGLTTDQQLFLAYGQHWCMKCPPAKLSQNSYLTHPPNRFRIIGPLQNNKDFARVFNCPAGSYMNPVDKCAVW